MNKISQNPKYLVYRDLIGLNVHAKNKNQKNNQEFFHAGIVIDETFNLIITSKEKDPTQFKKNQNKYVKKNYIFRFELDTEKEITIVEIDGIKLIKRIENRIKLLRKKRR